MIAEKPVEIEECDCDEAPAVRIEIRELAKCIRRELSRSAARLGSERDMMLLERWSKRL